VARRAGEAEQARTLGPPPPPRPPAIKELNEALERYKIMIA
jgi:hypothetical protein